MTALQNIWVFFIDVFLACMAASAYDSFKQTKDAFDIDMTFVFGALAVVSIPLFFVR